MPSNAAVSEHLLPAQRAVRAGFPSLSTSTWATLGPPDPSPPSPAPPSAPSPLMTARWRALSTMSSIPGQAAPQRLAAASPAGGPTMWMQVWAPRGLARSKGGPEPRLLPPFTWRLSHRFPHCQWHSPASRLPTFQRKAVPARAGRRTEQRRGAWLPRWAAEPRAWQAGRGGLSCPAVGLGPPLQSLLRFLLLVFL